MATTGPLTLLDLVKLNAGAGFEIVNEVGKLKPELSVLPVDTITGTEMELTVLKTLPTVSARKINQGTSAAKGEWENRIYQCATYDVPVDVDRAVYDRAKDKGRLLMQMTEPVMEATLFALCRQIYYGIGADPLSFPGLLAQTETGPTHVVDATATSAKTSVWFLATGVNKVCWLIGQDGAGAPAMLDTWRDVDLVDANGKVFPGLRNYIKARPGLRVANKNAVVRIKNLGTANGKTLTDALMFQALRLMNDLGQEPTAIFMNARSREQLRASRTATNAAGAPAPLPRDFEGIPIYVTNAISNDETA
jgi:hypothetical protein